MRSFLFALKKGLIVTIVFLTSLFQILAQNSWTVGGYEVFNNIHATTPLKMRSYGSASLKSASFLFRVGGVAFDAVAHPTAGTYFSSLSLSYNSMRVDGNRLTITIDDQPYTVNLPDWLLLPIARYANSNYTACVTLLGEESSLFSHHIQYHEAFRNTLLGMRLLQADMIFVDPVTFSQVFKRNGFYVLGKGENLPDRTVSSTAANKISKSLETFRNAGQGFDSYVMTDANNTIEFKITNNKFTLTGFPYYHFFQFGDDDNTVYESAQLNRSFRSSLGTIRDMNPLFFDAATRTMRYAAFFRYVKERHPFAWRSFITSIQNVRPLPAVTTPTTMLKNLE